MRGIPFVAVAVLLVPGLVLWAPLAWASWNCAAMGAACEGPCGAASCAVFGIPVGPGLPLMGDLIVPEVERLPSAPAALVELPPRASLLPA